MPAMRKLRCSLLCFVLIFLQIGITTRSRFAYAHAEDLIMPNPFAKTAGGTQFWTDHHWQSGGYRIQQNALTGHWRLLDSNNVRLASGTREECETQLRALSAESNDAEAGVNTSPRRFVILLHGLMRTRHSMKSLEDSLVASNAESGNPLCVIRFSYASTRLSIRDSAVALRDLVERLPSDAEISFMGHSMGNIVVRHFIGDLQSQGDPNHVLDRCKAMVMFGPPNQGAAIARRLSMTGLFGILTGQGGLELGPNWSDFEERLAVPPFPFAIIAGDVSHSPVQNPLVDGASDFVVSNAEARLDGATEFHKVAVIHSFLMNDEAAKKLAIDFFERMTT